MSFITVLRILARVKDAGRADATHHLSRRRPSLSGPKEPGRSIGKDGRMVRQIFEVTEFSFPVDRDRTRKEALSSLELRLHGPSLRTDIRRALLFLHHDRPSHLRVNRAKVFIGAWRTGDDREFLIGVEPR